VSVFKGDKGVAWGEFDQYIGAVTESHGVLLMMEDGVEDVMSLNVVLDSVEPLGVMVSDLDEFLPTFEVESPQKFAVAPVVS
jgi:hypothetical protein